MDSEREFFLFRRKLFVFLTFEHQLVLIPEAPIMNTPARKLTDALNSLRLGLKTLPSTLPTSNLGGLFSTFGPTLTQLSGWQQLQATLVNVTNGTQAPPTTAQIQAQLAQLQTQLTGTLTTIPPLPTVPGTTPITAPQATQAIGGLYPGIFNFYGTLLDPVITNNLRTAQNTSQGLFAGTFDPLATVLTPGADLLLSNFADFTLSFPRTGDDTIYAFDHSLNTVSQTTTHIEGMFGDTESVPAAILQDISNLLLGLPLTVGLAPRGDDRFVLGDWNTSFFNKSGSDDFAFIFDFNRAQDTIQLRGSAQNYISIEIPLLGTAIFEKKSTGLFLSEVDLVGVVFANYGLNLSSNYFKYVGPTSPAGIAQPKIKQIGSAGLDVPSAITTDDAGNVYTLGVTNSVLGAASQGSYDIVLTKYDSVGNQIWVTQLGTSRFDTPAFGLETDQAGNIFVVGSLIEEAFISKYRTADGSFVWTEEIVKSDLAAATNVAVDSVGNIYVTGLTLKPDPRPATDPNRVLDVQDDFWATKYDTNGTKLWFTEVGSPINSPGLFDETYGITLYESGGNVTVYTTGWTFGDFSGQGNFQKYDVPITKFNGATGAVEDFNPSPTGSFVNQFGTPEIDFSWQIDTDSAGNVYTMGRTTGNLGGANAGKEDVWLAKNRPNGTQEWVRQFGTSAVDTFYFGGLEIDNLNNIFVAGTTTGNLGGANAGSFDAWVARYDTAGNQIWIKQLGTAQLDYATDVTIDNNGNVYVTGFTEGSLGGTNKGSVDTWIAKYDLAGNLVNFTGGPPASNILNGLIGQKKFTVNRGDTVSIINFGGVGTIAPPPAAIAAEVDTLIFKGTNLTARNLLLEQTGADLSITFEAVADTKVILKNFSFENLENLWSLTSFGSNSLGNIAFNDQTQIIDNFDVINATAQPATIANSNATTFLNDLSNTVSGREVSDDVINGQGGDDILSGLSGSDLLRGGLGNDRLFGGFGNDTLQGDGGNDDLDGGSGNDTLRGGLGADRFAFSSGSLLGSLDSDTILDFNVAEGDKVVLTKSAFTAISSIIGNGFSNAADFAVIPNVNSTTTTSTAAIIYDSVGGGLYYNQNGAFFGLGSGALLATLTTQPTLTASSFQLI
jgi:Ca2+-binding RTX toxin-like protein